MGYSHSQGKRPLVGRALLKAGEKLVWRGQLVSLKDKEFCPPLQFDASLLGATKGASLKTNTLSPLKVAAQTSFWGGLEFVIFSL